MEADEVSRYCTVVATRDLANAGEHVRLDEVGFDSRPTIVLELHLHGVLDLTVVDLW